MGPVFERKGYLVIILFVVAQHPRNENFLAKQLDETFDRGVADRIELFVPE